MSVLRRQVGCVDTGSVRHTVSVEAETVCEAATRGLAACPFLRQPYLSETCHPL